MSLRHNALILATVVGATFAVGMAGANSTAPTTTAAKGDRLLTATLDCRTPSHCTAMGGSFVTVEYRGPNMSILARVPVAAD